MKYLRITMPDNSKWDVPVSVIASNRAFYYGEKHKDEFPTIVDARKDTEELFNSDPFEIEDWAQNNMNWSYVSAHAVKVSDPDKVDYQEGWVNGEKEVLEY